MKKYYIGYHNKPYDKTDFTIICETESVYAVQFIMECYNRNNRFLYVCYESRQLPENAHY